MGSPTNFRTAADPKKLLPKQAPEDTLFPKKIPKKEQRKQQKLEAGDHLCRTCRSLARDMGIALWMSAQCAACPDDWNSDSIVSDSSDPTDSDMDSSQDVLKADARAVLRAMRAQERAAKRRKLEKRARGGASGRPRLKGASDTRVRS